MNPRLARVLRLAKGLAAPFAGGVVVMRADETPEQAIARSGRTGAVIVMPEAPSAAQWERESVAQQQDLARRAAVFASRGWAGIFDPLQEQPDGAPSR